MHARPTNRVCPHCCHVVQLADGGSCVLRQVCVWAGGAGMCVSTHGVGRQERTQRTQRTGYCVCIVSVCCTSRSTGQHTHAAAGSGAAKLGEWEAPTLSRPLYPDGCRKPPST